ncbi:hypothetical protein ACQP2Y_37405 [Actinoplanes sp. CA-051413]|uniref:hypothetical protein n=1 Tax=Actinoplanes sp. CA-051413 TaxID=3239899 RepID=UPI003D993C27
MQIMKKALAAGATVALVTTTALVAGATPASAAVYGCAYPRVCFYKTRADWLAARPTASYRDYGYQRLGSASTNAYAIFNSRGDDGAKYYSRTPPGSESTTCLGPLQTIFVTYAYALDIRNDPGCR